MVTWPDLTGEQLGGVVIVAVMLAVGTWFTTPLSGISRPINAVLAGVVGGGAMAATFVVLERRQDEPE